jgi:hypothetical protein
VDFFLWRVALRLEGLQTPSLEPGPGAEGPVATLQLARPLRKNTLFEAVTVLYEMAWARSRTLQNAKKSSDWSR